MKQPIQTASMPINARVTIPGSKSITNRALLLAALADGVSELFDILISDDTVAFMDALRQLGIAIKLDETTRSCIVAGGQGHFPKKNASIWCADAGTAARFLLAACAASLGSYQLDASAQLRKRPILSLLRTLCAQGAKVIPEDAEKMPFTIVGNEGLRGGDIEIDGSETSQFISALLMVAPFAKTPVLLKSQKVVSNPYVLMTCKMMNEFGVLVRRMHQARYSVPAPQRYTACDYWVEPDLSTASYFFAAAAVTQGRVTIQPVDRKNAKQGDVMFLNVLEKMGCEVIDHRDGLSVQGPAELQGVSVDMRNFSDTFMTLAAVAVFAKTPTIITNIGHTRLQESNRITVMRKNLENLNIKVEEGNDWIKIYPSQPVSGVVDSHRDHRIAMACSIIGLRVPGIEIDGAECVGKTCPEFFELWGSLLGAV
jgi:3-phosphoshikimate 1-carboxyvinyltransferase